MERDFSYDRQEGYRSPGKNIDIKKVAIWFATAFGYLNTLWIIDRFNLGILSGGAMFVLWGVYGFLLSKNYKDWSRVFFVISAAFLVHASFVMTGFTFKHFSQNIPTGYGGYFLPLFFIFFLLMIRTLLKTGRLFTKTVFKENEVSSRRVYDRNNFDVPDFDTLILAGIVTNIFYLVFTFFPSSPADGWSWLQVIKEKFVDRGIIPILTVWLFFWALVILYLKAKRIVKEIKTETMIMNHFPEISSGRIPARDKFVTFLSDTLMHYKECIFHKRFSILIELIGKRSKKAMDDVFASQAELERNMITSSHTSLRFIIWAIPILGFLGTVWGISLSVSSLTKVLDNTAQAAAQGATSETSFSEALGGLGIAFDTTVVALSLSIIAMLLASYVRKIEDEQVTKAELLIQKF